MDAKTLTGKLAEMNLSPPSAAVTTAIAKREIARNELRDFNYTDAARVARETAIDSEFRKKLAEIEQAAVEKDTKLDQLNREMKWIRSHYSGKTEHLPVLADLVRESRDPDELLDAFKLAELSQHTTWIRLLGRLIERQFRGLKKDAQNSSQYREFHNALGEFIRTHPTPLEELTTLEAARAERESHIRRSHAWAGRLSGLPAPRQRRHAVS